MQVIDAVDEKVGTKRRNDKELANDRTKLVKPSFVGVDKENFENKVEQTVAKFLAPYRQKLELMR